TASWKRTRAGGTVKRRSQRNRGESENRCATVFSAAKRGFSARQHWRYTRRLARRLNCPNSGWWIQQKFATSSHVVGCDITNAFRNARRRDRLIRETGSSCSPQTTGV